MLVVMRVAQERRRCHERGNNIGVRPTGSRQGDRDTSGSGLSARFCGRESCKGEAGEITFAHAAASSSLPHACRRYLRPCRTFFDDHA